MRLDTRLVQRSLAMSLLVAGGAAVGLAVADVPRAAADETPRPAAAVYMTGALPIDDDEYARLPKVGRFRAWLPKRVDLTDSFPKPGYQGQQPNCVAWATAYAGRSYFNGRELGHQPAGLNEQISPAYLYNRIRAPGSACNRAIRIVDALNLLQTEGSVTLADFPDDISRCDIPAAPVLKSRAAAFRLGGWRAIDRERRADLSAPVVLDDIKGALARSQPVVFAMPVAPDWFALKSEIYRHTIKETTNYHAMALVGYDEDRQAFRVINSWGQDWGDKGYAWISYDTFRLLVGEAYALDNGPGRDTPPPGPLLSPEDTLAQLAMKLPCGSASVSNQSGHVTVSGFAGSQDAIAALNKAALAVDPHAERNVAFHPWPQCEGELTLARQMAAGDVKLFANQETGPARVGDPVTMQAGEKFGITAETTSAKPFLSIVYLQADGSAVELFRGAPVPDNSGRRKVTVGTSGPQEVRFQVAPPYGNEMVIAIASARPFWGADVKTYDTERQFLTGLRARLAAAPANSVSAAGLRILTRS